MPAGLRIGIDLGGTKIEGIVIDELGREAHWLRVPSPRDDYDATMRTIADWSRRSQTRASVPTRRSASACRARSRRRGPDQERQLHVAEWPCAADDLERVLDRPVRIANDADCFALSEATDGAARRRETVFGVIVGTGTGGGVVVNRQLLQRAERDCRGVGPQHAALAARRRVARARLLLRPHRLHRDVPVGAGPRARLRERRRRRPAGSRREICRLRGRAATRGRRGARALRHRIARGLASVINLLDPARDRPWRRHVQRSRLYEEVPRLWSEFVFSDRVDTRLVPPCMAIPAAFAARRGCGSDYRRPDGPDEREDDDDRQEATPLFEVVTCRSKRTTWPGTIVSVQFAI